MSRLGYHFAPWLLGVLTALLAAAALGAAYAMETWGGLVPCALCLLERWPYRVLIGLGLLAALLPRRLARLALWAALLCLLAEVALAAIHAGVEWHWWPSPLPECAAPRITGTTIAERLASMPLRPSKPCDEPNFLLPSVPLSIVGMNLVFALVFSAFLAIWMLTACTRTDKVPDERPLERSAG